ncbi:ZCN10 protein [Iris pallida]|uniref:ZCN10 protein n=1 Tax=Iris pallida TaxID=29817 RepID=A0AAX6F1L5_IRIPA|nr:ZCN10 protein [Iris pallida]
MLKLKMTTPIVILLSLFSLLWIPAHSAGSSYEYSQKLNVSNAADPLVVAKVIGDVVDPFVPSVNMSVNYGSNHVSDGIELKPSMTGNRPTVHIGGNEKDMYTLVLTDPDVPGPDNPFDREFLHWVVVNIPGGTEPRQGEEVVPYVRPAPPIGVHRYVFVLFKQEGKFMPKAGGGAGACQVQDTVFC